MPRAQAKPTASHAATLSEREIWTGAIRMIHRYGRDAVSEARHRLHVFAAEDELDVQLTWLKIIEAISWLQDDRPPRPRLLH
jgi:hypothetical protein